MKQCKNWFPMLKKINCKNTNRNKIAYAYIATHIHKRIRTEKSRAQASDTPQMILTF